MTIEPPGEGSLDRESWNRLVALLLAHSPGGADTPCLAYYCELATWGWRWNGVLSGCLGDAVALYDHPEAQASPSSLWAKDRTWAVYTDQDLWGTKVVGPPTLVEALLRDGVIEAVRLPWTRAETARGDRGVPGRERAGVTAGSGPAAGCRAYRGVGTRRWALERYDRHLDHPI